MSTFKFTNGVGLVDLEQDNIRNLKNMDILIPQLTNGVEKKPLPLGKVGNLENP